MTEPEMSYPLNHSEKEISMLKFTKRLKGECLMQAEPSVIIKNCLPIEFSYILSVEGAGVESQSFQGAL